MFRRIEIIHDQSTYKDSNGSDIILPAVKGGLCGWTTEDVSEAWIDKLQAPKFTFPFNTRFYFTEKGWKEIGRDVIAACQRSGQKYRVIRIKENQVNVVFRDEYQVAGQPARLGSKGRQRRWTDQDT
jgi:hypothetical protein